MSALAQHLIRQAAEEYQVDVKQLHKHLLEADPMLGEQIAQALQIKGWQIHWYKLSPPSCTDDLGMEHLECLSTGFVIQDTCDLLIQWKLQHASDAP